MVESDTIDEYMLYIHELSEFLLCFRATGNRDGTDKDPRKVKKFTRASN